MKISLLIPTYNEEENVARIHAEIDGIIKVIHAPAGSQVDAKDLLIEFE